MGRALSVRPLEVAVEVAERGKVEVALAGAGTLSHTVQEERQRDLKPEGDLDMARKNALEGRERRVHGGPLTGLCDASAREGAAALQAALGYNERQGLGLLRGGVRRAPTAPAGPSYVPNPNRLEAVTSYQQDYQAHALPPVAAPPSAPAYTPNPNRFEGSTTTADAYQPIELPVGVQALGVETMGAQFHTLIPAGTLPPAQGSAVFTTTHDNQTEVVIKALCMVGGKSVCLGSFELGGIQPKLTGIPQVLVQFDLDEKRILYVSAVDYGTHHRASLTVRPSNDNVLAGVEQLQLS